MLKLFLFKLIEKCCKCNYYDKLVLFNSLNIQQINHKLYKHVYALKNRNYNI